MRGKRRATIAAGDVPACLPRRQIGGSPLPGLGRTVLQGAINLWPSCRRADSATTTNGNRRSLPSLSRERSARECRAGAPDAQPVAGLSSKRYLVGADDVTTGIEVGLTLRQRGQRPVLRCRSRAERTSKPRFFGLGGSSDFGPIWSLPPTRHASLTPNQVPRLWDLDSHRPRGNRGGFAAAPRRGKILLPLAAGHQGGRHRRPGRIGPIAHEICFCLFTALASKWPVIDSAEQDKSPSLWCIVSPKAPSITISLSCSQIA